MDEGFARNIMKVFGPGSLYRGLGDYPLKSVTLDAEKEVITFSFNSLEAVPDIRFGVEGDCCSHSWIEHLEAPESVEGRTVVAVDDCAMDRSDDDEYEVTQVYQTVFRLDNGDSIKVEYRNTSNGYYGGYMVRLDPQGNRDYGDD